MSNGDSGEFSDGEHGKAFKIYWENRQQNWLIVWE
jgi:hypothetical protein